jgi:hypothetical protein
MPKTILEKSNPMALEIDRNDYRTGDVHYDLRFAGLGFHVKGQQADMKGFFVSENNWVELRLTNKEAKELHRKLGRAILGKTTRRFS